MTALVHIPMAQLLQLPLAQELAARWIRQTAAAFAGETAREATEPGLGGAWLTGDDAGQMLIGALMTPIVTACPDISVLDKLAEAGHRLHCETDPAKRYGLAADVLGLAVKALSGPGGFASFLRTRLFDGTVLGSGSLVLDAGRSRVIPRQLRIAVALRDRGCAKPGCDKGAACTEPHHVVFYSRGGLTNQQNLKQYCGRDHHGLIHRDDWRCEMHPDGTVELYRPDGSRYTPGVRYQPPEPEPPEPHQLE